MLAIFRKYQKYIYAVITFIIIISFSFFGTYSAMQRADVQDPVVFTTMDGTKVTRSELEQTVQFLGSNNEDKLLFGGAWGPNFLNNGVITKDILKPGIGEVLVEQYPALVRSDLSQRTPREKHYKPYTHPHAGFINAEAVWDYIAPSIPANIQIVKDAKDPTSPKAFDARVQLFLAERKFPSPALRQVLKYQEKQYPWVPADPNLNRADLSIFGYHTLSDWFGPNFIRLSAEFIINSAAIAQQKGYDVSKEEALAELMRNSQLSFEQNIRNPNLGVTNNSEYFLEQLRRMGIDQKTAVKIWQKVMLFRRLFQDAGNSAIVPPFAYQKFADYADEYVAGELYQLPEALRLGSFSDLKKLQLYIDAVAKGEPGPLAVPTEYKSVKEVKEKAPQLVQQSYELQIQEVEKQKLQTRVSVKETWDWEVKDANWEKLKKEFPDLGIEKANTRSARFDALDRLNPKTRSRVDAFARKEIVESHPEWVKEALEQSKPKDMTVEFGIRGGKTPIAGLKDRAHFVKLLQAAPLNEEPKGELAHFSPDGEHYYAIKVIGRGEKEEIVTFAKAKDQGIMDEMLEHSDKSFDHVLAAIRKAMKDEKMIPDRAATNRFYPYVEKIRDDLMKNPEKGDEFVGYEPNLKAQWKLVATQTRVNRNNANEEVQKLLKMKEGEWSPLFAPANGDLNFFHLTEKGAAAGVTAISDEVKTVHQALSQEAKQTLSRDLLQKMVKNKAINMKFYQRKEEE